jgi:hypothetical protein
MRSAGASQMRPPQASRAGRVEPGGLLHSLIALIESLMRPFTFIMIFDVVGDVLAQLGDVARRVLRLAEQVLSCRPRCRRSDQQVLQLAEAGFSSKELLLGKPLVGEAAG